MAQHVTQYCHEMDHKERLGRLCPRLMNDCPENEQLDEKPGSARVFRYTVYRGILNGVYLIILCFSKFWDFALVFWYFEGTFWVYWVHDFRYIGIPHTSLADSKKRSWEHLYAILKSSAWGHYPTICQQARKGFICFIIVRFHNALYRGNKKYSTVLWLSRSNYG